MQELDKKIIEAKKSVGFLITISTYDPKKRGKELDHWYLTNNFPKQDINKSIDATKVLLKVETEIQKSTGFAGQ